MDKTRDSTNSKIWTDSTCAISVRRKGQILLVVESLVLSTTHHNTAPLSLQLRSYKKEAQQVVHAQNLCSQGGGGVAKR